MASKLGLLDIVVKQTSPIALCEIKDIYRLRAKRNENREMPIQGFPALLAGLEAFSGDKVVIYSVATEQGTYKVFADEALTEIAGILKLPAEPLGKVLPALSELQTA